MESVQLKDSDLAETLRELVADLLVRQPEKVEEFCLEWIIGKRKRARFASLLQYPSMSSLVLCEGESNLLKDVDRCLPIRLAVNNGSSKSNEKLILSQFENSNEIKNSISNSKAAARKSSTLIIPGGLSEFADLHDKFGNTILHCLGLIEPADYGLTAAKMLLQGGGGDIIDIEARNSDGFTPLAALAAISANEAKTKSGDTLVAIVELLLAAKADPTAETREGKRPADLASEGGVSGIIPLILRVASEQRRLARTYTNEALSPFVAQLFCVADNDHDEMLTEDDVFLALRNSRPEVDEEKQRQYAIDLFKRADTNGNGMLEVHEWLDYLSEKALLMGVEPTVQELKSWFYFEMLELERKDNFYRYTPLLSACAEGDLAAVVSLLEKKASVAARDRWHGSCLHVAASRAHVQIVEILLKASADPNAVDERGNSPLIVSRGKASFSNRIKKNKNGYEDALSTSKIIHSLLNHGAEINAKGEFGRTALLAAAAKLSGIASVEGTSLLWLEKMCVLIKAKADISAKTTGGDQHHHHHHHHQENGAGEKKEGDRSLEGVGQTALHLCAGARIHNGRVHQHHARRHNHHHHHRRGQNGEATAATTTTTEEDGEKEEIISNKQQEGEEEEDDEDDDDSTCSSASSASLQDDDADESEPSKTTKEQEEDNENGEEDDDDDLLDDGEDTPRKGMRLLLASRANPNAVDALGRTPLFYASASAERIDLLSSHGANLLHRDSEGRTALDLLTQGEEEVEEEVVTNLLQRMSNYVSRVQQTVVDRQEELRPFLSALFFHIWRVSSIDEEEAQEKTMEEIISTVGLSAPDFAEARRDALAKSGKALTTTKEEDQVIDWSERYTNQHDLDGDDMVGFEEWLTSLASIPSSATTTGNNLLPFSPCKIEAELRQLFGFSLPMEHAEYRDPKTGRTALLNAAAKRNYEYAEQLIDAGANAKATDLYGLSALHLIAQSTFGGKDGACCSSAASKATSLAANLLVGKDASSDSSFLSSLSPLSSVPESCPTLRIMSKLVNDGGLSVDVEDLSSAGMIPLMRASSPHAVAALLQLGADVKRRNKDGQTALHVWAGCDLSDETVAVVASLCSALVSLSSGEEQQQTNKQLKKRKAILKSLIQSPDPFLSTPLHIAACAPDTQAAEKLVRFLLRIEKAVDVTALTEGEENEEKKRRSKKNKTSQLVARDIRDGQGQTPLLVAILQMGDVSLSIVQILLDSEDENPSPSNNNPLTNKRRKELEMVLSLADKEGTRCMQIVQLLRSKLSQ